VELCTEILQIMRNNFKDYARTFCQLCAHYAHLFGFVLHTIGKTTFINETDYAVSALSDSDVTSSSAPGGKITHGAPRLAIYIVTILGLCRK